jgi:drug/metabolite transporter (DMT)-like permease
MNKSLALKAIKSNTSLLAWAALVLLSLIWGSSFILIKKSLLAFSALEVGALRITIATIAFLPFFLHHLKEVPWHKLKYFILVGLCGSGLPSFLYAIAQTKVDSSIAGLLNSLTPIFTLLIGLFIFKTL